MNQDKNHTLPATQDDKKLFDILNIMAKLRDGFVTDFEYNSSEQMVLTLGELFNPKLKPDEIRHGEKKMCYKNAHDLSVKHGYTYVEGYALADIGIDLPIAHAWVVDEQGNVIDNTWDRPGRAYFGIAFNTDFLIETIYETGEYGIAIGATINSFLDVGLPDRALEQVENAYNGKGYNPYRDGKGRFASGPKKSETSGGSDSAETFTNKDMTMTEFKEFAKTFDSLGHEDASSLSGVALDIYGFQSNDSWELNRKLHKSVSYKTKPDLSDREEKIVKSVEDSMVHELGENTYLYRGLRVPQKLIVGSELESGGFSSTSFSNKSSERFLDTNITDTSENPYVLKIRVPRGTKGLIPSSVTKDNYIEQEFVLPRGAKFKVLSSTPQKTRLSEKVYGETQYTDIEYNLLEVSYEK